MKKFETIRALRDPEYRSRLSAAEKANLPSHPAGLSNVADDALKSITGGCGYTACNTCGFGSTPDFSCMPPGVLCP